MAPALLDTRTCKFKTKRAGLHKPILRGSEREGWTCGDCYLSMRRDLAHLFDERKSGPTFCHECGVSFKSLAELGPGETMLMALHYRDSGPIILCEACDRRYNALISGEASAIATERERMIIKSVEARAAIAEAVTIKEKQTLFERFRAKLGRRRKV